ncbi:hypothetical protein DT250_24500 [Bacillus sp. AR2-1]|nr:hypothetical protein DT250_24500 [Bacillus sp. AR2-1]
MDIPEEYLQHIPPLGWEHITLTGDYVWDLNEKTNFNNLRPFNMYCFYESNLIF